MQDAVRFVTALTKAFAVWLQLYFPRLSKLPGLQNFLFVPGSILIRQAYVLRSTF